MYKRQLLALAGIHAVILFDLFTFFAAFLSLLFLVNRSNKMTAWMPASANSAVANIGVSMLIRELASERRPLAFW